ncbi:MAG: hypothetical protein JWO67_6787 [Streptosporangiaceae bacterium]|nr:hypothetical protein [Streptosporangiaceae bacterium]
MTGAGAHGAYVWSENELLALTGAATLADLGAVLDADAEVDLEIVQFRDGVEVRAWSIGLLLTYPFLLDDIFTAADDVERDELLRLHN